MKAIFIIFFLSLPAFATPLHGVRACAAILIAHSENQHQKFIANREDGIAAIQDLNNELARAIPSDQFPKPSFDGFYSSESFTAPQSLGLIKRIQRKLRNEQNSAWVEEANLVTVAEEGKLQTQIVSLKDPLAIKRFKFSLQSVLGQLTEIDPETGPSTFRVKRGNQLATFLLPLSIYSAHAGPNNFLTTASVSLTFAAAAFARVHGRGANNESLGAPLLRMLENYDEATWSYAAVKARMDSDFFHSVLNRTVSDREVLAQESRSNSWLTGNINWVDVELDVLKINSPEPQLVLILENSRTPREGPRTRQRDENPEDLLGMGIFSGLSVAPISTPMRRD